MRCLLLRPCAKRSYLHDEEFQESDESKDLQSSWDGDRERSIPSRSKIRELGTGIVDITREVHATLVDKVAHNTKHTDASVLDFDIAKAIKLFLVSVGNESKRIKESKLKRARIKNQQSQTKRRGKQKNQSRDKESASVSQSRRRGKRNNQSRNTRTHGWLGTKSILEGLQGGGGGSLLGRGKGGGSRNKSGEQSELHGRW